MKAGSITGNTTAETFVTTKNPASDRVRMLVIVKPSLVRLLLMVPFQRVSIRLFEGFHGNSVRSTAVADPSDAEIRKHSRRRNSGPDKDVHGNSCLLTQAFDERRVHQARSEKPARTGLGVRFRALDHLLQMFVGVRRGIERKHYVASSVNKERNAAFVSRFPDRTDPVALLLDRVQAFTLNNAIFEVDADRTGLDHTFDVRGQFAIAVRVTAFEIQRDGHADSSDDPLEIRDRKLERQPFSIFISVC